MLLIFGLKGLTISVSTRVPIRESHWDEGLWNLRGAAFICHTNVHIITDAWAVLTVARFTHTHTTNMILLGGLRGIKKKTPLHVYQEK